MRLKEKLLTGLLLVPLAGTSAWAKERGNYDAFLASPDAKSLPATEAELVARGARVEHMEQRLGLPTVLWNEQLDSVRSNSLAGLRPEQAARAHLQKFADVYRLTSQDIASATLQSVHKTEFGPVIARFGQKVEGVEVFRGGVNVVMDRNHNLVAITGYLAPHDAVAARVRTVGTDFQMSAADAIARAFKDLTDTTISGRSLVSTGAQGSYTHFSFAPGVAAVMPHAMATPARAKRVYFTLPDGLEPAYYVELNVGTKSTQESDYYSFVVSATDGRLLSRNNLTADDNYSYRVWANTSSFIPFDGPQGDDPTPHPTGDPDRYQAPFIPPNLVTLQNYPFSRNDPWLAPLSTQTTGNNVDAYADLGGSDGFQVEFDLRANTSAPGVFDYTYDVTRAPNFSVDQQKAAIAHLFYLNNFLHDWYYDAGFDEISGNAQALNYGRGGLEGDSIKAEAQDFSGRNNANMSTPSDGARPRMQMYVFDGVPNMNVLSPGSLAGGYEVGTGAFGSLNYDLTGELQILDPNGNTFGCEPFPAGTFAGKIAVIDRGPLPPAVACGFTVKALLAQQAGAIAVLLANHTDNQPAPGMGGTDPAITVPVLSVTKEAADAWKAEVRTNGSTINVRMQRNPNLDRDGTIDNQIVAHEWGHYISNRLVGDSNGLINNQGRAMGEGWADFHAMLMTARDEDRNRPGNNLFQGVYAMAGYTQSGGVNNGYYFGIRRLPYSTNMLKNGLTFRHTANGNPLPTNHPVGSGAAGTGNSQVHNSGEVWGTMLWECYVSLLNAHPFQEAQNRMKHYLVAAYKATPVAPTFLEARDAVLAVAAASDPADYARFVQAFAKRGAGFGAKAADRNAVDHVGVVESFVSGNNLEIVGIRVDDSVTGCDRDGVLDQGEVGQLSVTVRNNGAGPLASFNGTVTASGATAAFTFPSGNTLNFPALPRFATRTVSVPIQLTGVTGTEPRAGLTVTFNEPSLPPSAATATYNERVHYDAVLSGAGTDTFETELSAWTNTRYGTLPGWARATERVGTITNSYMHAIDHSVLSDTLLTSPWIRVNPTGNFILSYAFRHSLEGTVSGSGMVAPFYDGVVLEVTADGANWYDVYLDLGINPGYTAFLSEGDSPISGRAAFVGTNPAFPNWNAINVNFGPLLAGLDVRFRFRLGTDSLAGAYGFDLDDVRVQNAAVLPFSGIGPELSDGSTCNRRPVADAGLPRSVPERDAAGNLVPVVLNGTASFDPDGQPLTYSWTQVAGPAVTLNSPNSATPTFTADVPASVNLVFQLVVNDGVDSSHPRTVTITILNTNRKPIAVPSGPTTVAERSVPAITLSGADSTDADGETLSYAWAQTAGPAVTITGEDTALMSFETPEVPADTQYTFQLVVSDGITSSEPALFTVTVTNVDRLPTADAGEDRTVDGRAAITLQGSGNDPDGDAVTYEWIQTAGPSVTLSGADTATPSFTSPIVPAQAVLSFQLTVTANGQTATDTVDITVRADRGPNVNAGVDQIVDGRTAVNLFGSASDPEGDALTYAWTVVDAPTGVVINLQGADTATPSFTSPDIKVEGTITFRLTVTSNGLSNSDTVTVRVRADRAPVANAGSDRSVNAGESVSLSGSGSDPESDALAYAWVQTAGPSVTLAGPNTASPSFTAPRVTNETVLTFQLTITANDLTATDTVSITIRSDRAPVANAGVDRTVEGRASVTLQGFGSDADGDAVTYDWTQVAGPAVSLTGADTATPSFTSPTVAEQTVLTFQLTVTAGGLTATDTVTITVRADQAPVANAGADREVRARDTVTLQGFGSDADGDAVTYAWTQEGGPSVTLTGADSATPSFTAPDVRNDTVLTFRLTVSANGLSSTDTVAITVKKFNRRPVGQGLTSLEEREGTAIMLDASQSSDPDGDTLTYHWTQTGGPQVQVTGQDTATLQFTAPDVTADTTLSFSLVVSDTEGLQSEMITVSVKVLNVNKAPTAQARKLSGAASGETFTLDASLSSDPDGERLTYKWEQTDGPSVTLSSDSEPSVTFQAPTTTTNLTLTFKVTVTDSHGATASQEVQVEVAGVEEKKEDDGGCASTGNSSGGAMLLALLAGVLLTRRRITLRA